MTNMQVENGEPSEQIELVLKVSHERINDLICGAMEGGSNHWYCIDSFNYPVKEGTLERHTKESLGIKFGHIELPMKGGSLTISDSEDGGGNTFTLDKEACIRGLGPPLTAGLRIESQLFNPLLTTHDFHEGPISFAEKRKPEFDNQ